MESESEEFVSSNHSLEYGKQTKTEKENKYLDLFGININPEQFTTERILNMLNLNNLT